MAEISLKDWHAESLRFSVFLVDATIPSEAQYWQQLLEQLPEEQRNQPQQHLYAEEGPFLSGRLRVEVRPDRVDWKLLLDPKSPPIEFPSLGSYAPLESRFRNLMLQWLTACPPINRLAYAGVFLLPSDDSLDVYTKLDGFLPSVQVDRENTRDLTYRINRRRRSNSGVEGVEINRLSTWSSIQIVGTLMNITVGGTHTPKVTHLSDAKHLCRLELDVNTSPEFKNKLEKDYVSNIFNELVDAANEIAVKGDVP